MLAIKTNIAIVQVFGIGEKYSNYHNVLLESLNFERYCFL